MHINAILDHSFSENEDNAPFREISGIKLTKIGATFTIRKARRLMTSEEPLSGTTTVIRCNDGERVHRKFQKNACFQDYKEVREVFSNVELTNKGSYREVTLENVPDRIREVRRKRVSVAPLKDGMKEVYDWAGSMEDVPLHFTIHRGQKLVTHECRIDDHCAATLVKRAAEEAAQMLSSQVSFDGSYTFLGPQELSNTLPEDGDIIKEKKRRKDKRTTSERKRAKKEKSAAASTKTD
ncbi:hypothetical protein P5673_014071 [Acropora cervicornis]|uniref:Uncharacterized protein n=1 Tax=Acropora cervicornis TaxID=6130 RepID=A0AAD9QJP6_ACRCE|nr:hypothetical protein P5673_014071 [Acropora cervicornis]